MRLSLFSALLIAAVTSACGSSTGTEEDLRVDAKTSLAKFKAGDAVVVTITVTNQSNSSIDLPVGNCPTHFAVRNSSGVIVGPPSEVCSLQLMVKTFVPGEKFEYTSTWHGEGFAATAGATTYLKPGIYTIEGLFGVSAAVNNPVSVEITS